MGYFYVNLEDDCTLNSRCLNIAHSIKPLTASLSALSKSSIKSSVSSSPTDKRIWKIVEIVVTPWIHTKIKPVNKHLMDDSCKYLLQSNSHIGQIQTHQSVWYS